jgi:predicted XRE-type DNA-binding protein
MIFGVFRRMPDGKQDTSWIEYSADSTRMIGGPCRRSVREFVISGGAAIAGTDGEEAMSTEVFESVWDALEDTPTEAENMKLRSSLMIAINEAVASWGMTQTDAAKRLGVTQPRLNDLLRGRVGKFSLDALVALAARAGLAVHLEITLAA